MAPLPERVLFKAFQDTLDEWYEAHGFERGTRPAEVSAALGWLQFLLCTIGEADADLVEAARRTEQEQVTDLVREKLLGQPPPFRAAKKGEA